MRRQPHQQGNRFSKQRLRHGRPVSRQTIAPRQRRRIFYHFLMFQTHQQNLPDKHDQCKGHLPGIAAAASDSGFCLACHTHNPSHVAHLYRGDCLKKKRPVRSRSGSIQPITRRTAPFAQPADIPTPETLHQCQDENADDRVKEEVMYEESNAGEDSRTKERSPTLDRPSSFQSADGDGWERGINAGGLMLVVSRRLFMI